jgi:hypothetical protein
MANFTKYIGLAGALVVFAGVASAQPDTCAAVAPSTNIIRAEGTTELLPQITVSCTGTGVAGTLSLQIFLSPALPITSKVINTGNGQTEAIAQVVNPGTGLVSAGVNGTVSGSTLNFSGLASVAGNFTVLISNVRVNASSITVGTGVPPTVSATAFVSGSAGTITPIALSYNNLSFVQNGLGTTKVNKNFTTGAAWPQGTSANGGANNFVICNPYAPKNFPVTTAGTVSGANGGNLNDGLAFVVQINENFASSFKAVGVAGSQAVANAFVIGTGEQSEVPNNNAVVAGTRLVINFANVPSNVALYVPNAVIPSTAGGGVATIQLNGAAAGSAYAAVASSSSSSVSGNGTGLVANTPAAGAAGGGLSQVSISSGAGSAVFEVISQDLNNLDSFNVPVFVVTSANAVPGSSTAITATVSFNPVGSTAIPNFAVTGSSNTVTGSTFNLCTTSLLFPFMTNTLGFDTGLAISNTSTDPFGGAGATAQAGTCTLNFYGAGAPSPSNVVTPTVPSGTTYVNMLSMVAPGFQGYIIAQCAFQYAYGFAFITDGVGANGGLSDGYLAGIIPDVNQQNRGANPLSQAGAGTGETLGN